ncbi:Hsp20/alpha crystallin family protein [Aquimarina sp. 2201CG5-10]|uniref:Hsp20/alpha crystallin family protein n=1 Tax=Aquimarina callyspongiae TaxID=3098150 RepID=UPI002AB437EE|nr:Hsp20/alpha crystallin family protein [Aquimarina sp. 2201CG5-10]MDY8134034.1 Hsp20/alpha crystallin family protein [Aquimarina sp. 2201CG5-10]
MSLVKRTDRLPFLLDDFFNADWFGGTTNPGKIGFNTPAVNVIEADDNYKVELAAPGLRKEDFNIELDNDVLTISSEIKSEKESKDKDGRYTRKEFGYSAFKRSFNLPETVNGGAIQASYDNGVLLVTLPKKEEAKVQPKRLIDIS